jgi:hypothetical protein
MYTVLRALSIQKAKEQGVWREELDFHNADDDEYMIVGSTCTRGVWNDKCGCTRSMSGINSMMGSTVFYIDKIYAEDMKRIQMESKYAEHWGLEMADFLRMTEFRELSREMVGTVIQIMGGTAETDIQFQVTRKSHQ